jgi:hypothetical protein
MRRIRVFDDPAGVEQRGRVVGRVAGLQAEHVLEELEERAVPERLAVVEALGAELREGDAGGGCAQRNEGIEERDQGLGRLRRGFEVARELVRAAERGDETAVRGVKDLQPLQRLGKQNLRRDRRLGGLGLHAQQGGQR